MALDFKKLFRMSEGCTYGALHLVPRDKAMSPDGARQILRGEITPQYPIVLDYSMGGKPRDVIGTGMVHIKAFADRAIETLREGGFTGWTTYPVEIYGKNKERIEGYQGFAVTGRCGPIDDSKSPLESREPRVPGGRRVQRRVGMYFDPQTWDGSDIFMAEQWGCVFVVERVKLTLEKIKVKNFSFTRLTEVER